MKRPDAEKYYWVKQDRMHVGAFINPMNNRGTILNIMMLANYAKGFFIYDIYKTFAIHNLNYDGNIKSLVLAQENIFY